MPTTLVGFILFATLLIPGAVFVNRRNLYATRPKPSPLTEAIATVFASVGLVALTLIFFAPIRAAFPKVTPKVGRFIADPKAYFTEEYSLLLTWGAILLTAACLGGWLIAPPMVRLQKKLNQAAPVDQSSGWSRVLQYREDKRCYLQCRLSDNALVSGYVWSFNSGVEEHEERSITLTGEGLSVIYPAGEMQKRIRGGQAHSKEMIGSGEAIILSSSSIVWMSVEWRDPD